MVSYTTGMTFSQLLREWMDSPDAPSQTEVAQRLGVSQATISRWKSGAMTPGVDKSESLANLIGIPENDLARAVYEQAKRAAERAGAQARNLEVVLALRKAELELREALPWSRLARNRRLAEAVQGLREAVEQVTEHLKVDALDFPMISDDNFAQAAEGGPTEEVGERVHRPQPDPED